MTTSEIFNKIKGEDNINLKFFGLIFVVALIIGVAKQYQGNIYIQQLFEGIDKLGVWAPILYIAFYILMSGILMPSIVFKVFAGTIFGVLNGIIWVSIASTISSLIKFLLARYLFQDTINKKIQHNQSLRRVDEMIEKEGWKMLMLMRNIPIVNSMLLNYICGATKMNMKDFVWASFIGRLPTTFLYVYLGYLVGYSSGVDGTNQTRITFEWVLLFLGLLASVGLAYYIIYISKKIVSESLPQSTLSIKS